MEELFPKFPILVVDNEEYFLNSLDFQLRSNRITNIECCQNGLNVIPCLKNQKYSVVLLDLFMPDMSGEELLPMIIDEYPDIPVIVVTAFPDNKTATDCMKKGAFDSLTKPVKIKDLIRTIRDALNLKDSHEEIIQLKKALFSDAKQKPKIFFNIITQNEKIQSIFPTLGLIAVTSRPLLIWGEVGVGKEFVAREIHKQSRRKGEFVSFTTTGIDDDSFSGMLYGQNRKSYLGEEIYKGGLLEKAQGGTLYLSEIGDLSKRSQEKLLRLLQEWEYCPFGINKPIDVNVRIIAATNKNLTALTQVKTFIQDLYFLLKTHHIYIPPLRDRKEDIPLLVNYFVKQAAENIGVKTPSLSGDLFILLEQYDFPGNISELKKMVYEAVSRHESGNLSLEIFIKRIRDRTFVSSYGIKIPTNKKVIFEKNLPTLAEMEAIYMDEVMKRSGGNQTAAAQLAGLNITTFIHRLKKIKKGQKKEKRRK